MPAQQRGEPVEHREEPVEHREEPVEHRERGDAPEVVELQTGLPARRGLIMREVP